MISLKMNTCCKKDFHLVAHVVAYATCCMDG